ncbi:hypothetical protein AKJ52_00060 [candidate division MSBL1 archaeon SCGC-AAA382C18]|uniref:Uncharacterized protein n=1 Tax=candidate division MSBL1 archaeon SCGC-AAA382C18 TaxID=1698281 RepID=A0A133VM53_9EURY|nr:hypothetical protein AKJ52_00060 [candidate division MSBL1 archaeon SCGC-AAA382C18]
MSKTNESIRITETKKFKNERWLNQEEKRKVKEEDYKSDRAGRSWISHRFDPDYAIKTTLPKEKPVQL